MIIRNSSKQSFHATGQPSDFANFLWVMILMLVGVGGSLIISCVTPFVALAIALAGTVRLPFALRAMTAIWLLNQLIGFVFFHFPRTPATILWGLAIGGAALLSTLAAASALKRAVFPMTVRLGLALVFCYAVYEMTLFGTALLLDATETLSPLVIAQIGLVNFLWLVGLVALNELVAILGKTWLGTMPRLAKT